MVLAHHLEAQRVDVSGQFRIASGFASQLSITGSKSGEEFVLVPSPWYLGIRGAHGGERMCVAPSDLDLALTPRKHRGMPVGTGKHLPIAPLNPGEVSCKPLEIIGISPSCHRGEHVVHREKTAAARRGRREDVSNRCDGG